MTSAFFLYGGWPGHFPYEVAEWADGIMDDLGFEVTHTNDPHRLEEDLTAYDVIVCGWTQAMTTEDLTDRAERSLLDAVAQGTGFVGWHGATASFRSSLPFSFLLVGDVEIAFGINRHAVRLAELPEEFRILGGGLRGCRRGGPSISPSWCPCPLLLAKFSLAAYHAIFNARDGGWVRPDNVGVVDHRRWFEAGRRPFSSCQQRWRLAIASPKLRRTSSARNPDLVTHWSASIQVRSKS